MIDLKIPKDAAFHLTDYRTKAAYFEMVSGGEKARKLAEAP